MKIRRTILFLAIFFALTALTACGEKTETPNSYSSSSSDVKSDSTAGVSENQSHLEQDFESFPTQGLFESDAEIRFLLPDRQLEVSSVLSTVQTGPEGATQYVFYVPSIPDQVSEMLEDKGFYYLAYKEARGSFESQGFVIYLCGSSTYIVYSPISDCLTVATNNGGGITEALGVSGAIATSPKSGRWYSADHLSSQEMENISWDENGLIFNEAAISLIDEMIDHIT